MQARGTTSHVKSNRLSISNGQRVKNEGTVLDHFIRNVSLSPHETAVECGKEHVSYAELAKRATNLANHLVDIGVIREQVVAVRLSRSINRTVAFVGILMAGAVYLPIDPSMPDDRMSFMLADAEVPVVITDSLADLASSEVRVLPVASIPDPPETESLRSPLPRARDAAYVIYTSGTTGLPKGVVVEHGSLSNCAQASIVHFEIARTSRVSQVSSFGFDIAVGDLAMALCAGACLVAPQDHTAQPGSPLGAFVRDSRISHLSITPSALSAMPLGDYLDLTHIIVCGEKCSLDLANRWMSNRRFFNAYGPAEATVWCTAEECSPGKSVGIGWALPNTNIYILDENKFPVEVGAPGELWIGGAGLARGYLNREDLTRERFPFVRIKDEYLRLYKTGDLAKMSENGRIHFLGRSDDQIKLRGFRVELGEIEVAIRRHPQVKDAVVDLRKPFGGADRLVGYLIPANDEIPSNEELSSFLESWLPRYMIPSIFVRIERIPLNQNRKLDRGALPDPLRPDGLHTGLVRKAYTSTEAALVNLFRKELHFNGSLGTRDTLGDLGVDSLQTANLFLAIESHFSIELPVEVFSNADTIELLSLHIEAARGKPAHSPPTNPSLLNSIVRKQRGHFSAWTGSRLHADSLICTHNASGRRQPLFWCFQGTQEHVALANALGSDQPLHGMRSGYLIFRYTEDNVRTLAVQYASEMMAIQPKGDIALGGNCQGGIIAREIAIELRARGRTINLLCLLGQGRFSPFTGRVALIFSNDGKLNPYKTMKNPGRLFDTAYKAGYTISFVQGTDDNAFASPNVETLAATIHKQLDGVVNDHQEELNGAVDGVRRSEL